MQGARWAIGLATVVVLGGALVARAASLGMTTGSLGAAAQVVSSCQTEPIHVSYVVDASGDVTGVTLNDIDSSSCHGATMLVSITDTSSQVLADTSSTVESSSVTVPVTHTHAADIFGVHVSIAS